MNDYISRADAIEAMCNDCGADNGDFYPNCWQKEYCAEVQALVALPSAEADSDDLIIKGAKGIQDGLYNIKDGKLFKYKAKGGTVRVYEIVPSAEAVHGEWKRVPTRTYKGECTNCGFRHIFMDGHDSQYRFCPYCGAKMTKGGDDE